MEITAGEIATWVGGTVIGDPSVRIRGVNGLEFASEGDIAFLDSPRYRPHLNTTRASVVLVPPDVASGPAVLIQVTAPRFAFAQVLARLSEEKQRHPKGIHPTAVIGENVHLGKDVGIDAHVKIADDAVIGDGTVIYAGTYIGRATIIGARTVIHANVSIREECQIGADCLIHSGVVIGSDGFGFVFADGRQNKIPQVGIVIIGNNVEIGANSCIDRATFGETRIGDGTKIDNLVQIGHNVRIGSQCAVSGMVGIGGSTTLGDRVIVGGNAGFAGHLTVGDDVMIGGRSGVTKSIPSGRIVSGFPAVDHNEARRIRASFSRLPEALRRIKDLESRLEEFERHLHGKTENNR